jgi:cell division protein FtsN
VPATKNGTSLYRVRVGPVTSEAEARQLLSKVVDHGYPGARLVEQ